MTLPDSIDIGSGLVPMSDLTKIEEEESFAENLPQVEKNHYVTGGKNGISNIQAWILGNRTRWLKSKIDAFIAGTGLTKSMVGLANVDNTADLAKPISTATQTALNAKAPLSSPAFMGTVTGITKSMIGLSNVDNTADLSKPISTATQTALNAKAPLSSPAFTGTVTGITKSMIGLSNVDNTADLAKPISTATQNVLDSFVGQVAFFAMETAPTGWLKANGATISRTTYSNLFNKIGTTFGAGDSSTTFKIPDMRGEFVRGWNDGGGVDASRVFGSQQISTQIQVDDDDLQIMGAMSVSQNSLSSHGFELPQLNSTNVHYTEATTTSSVVNQLFLASIRPRNIALLVCIKY